MASLGLPVRDMAFKLCLKRVGGSCAASCCPIDRGAQLCSTERALRRGPRRARGPSGAHMSEAATQTGLGGPPGDGATAGAAAPPGAAVRADDPVDVTMLEPLIDIGPTSSESAGDAAIGEPHDGALVADTAVQTVTDAAAQTVASAAAQTAAQAGPDAPPEAGAPAPGGPAAGGDAGAAAAGAAAAAAVGLAGAGGPLPAASIERLQQVRWCPLQCKACCCAAPRRRGGQSSGKPVVLRVAHAWQWIDAALLTSRLAAGANGSGARRRRWRRAAPAWSACGSCWRPAAAGPRARWRSWARRCRR